MVALKIMKSLDGGVEKNNGSMWVHLCLHGKEDPTS